MDSEKLFVAVIETGENRKRKRGRPRNTWMERMRELEIIEKAHSIK